MHRADEGLDNSAALCILEITGTTPENEEKLK